MMQSPYAFSRRPARAFHLRIFSAILLAALVAGPSVAQLDESCVVGALNRIAPVRPDGTWVLPNVPDNMGLIRVRATCVENGVTRFGQSDLIAVPTNGVLRVEEIHFDQMALVPSRLELDAPRTVLSAVGESVQLTTTAFFPDASTADVTVGSSGTSYTISNPRVASVGPDGLLTALASGSVVVTAANEGATSFLFFQIVVSADSDGDGLPDDFEVANGLDPNDPLDAQMDQDRDGLTTLAEFLVGLDPRNPDTDGDTLLDGEEDAYLTDPLLFDTDGDGLSDGLEVQLGTDPTDPNDFDLAGALSAITVSPTAFNLVFNSVLGEASIQLAVSGLLIDGNTLDLTARGITYTSSDLTVCSFGAAPGRVFAGVDGACTITAEISGFSAQASGTVSSFEPLPLARITLPGSTNNVDVAGGFAYVAAGSAGLVVVDVQNPAAPSIAATVDTPGNARDVKVAGSVAYVADGPAGLRLFDLSNPASPVFLGAFDTPGDAKDVEVRGSLVYLADGNQGMRVIDAGDPAAPALIGSIGALGTLGTVNGVDVDMTTGIAVAAAGSRLRVIDVSAPALPVLRGTATIGGNAQAVVLRDGYAHVADLSRSLTVVDVRDPATPLVGVSTPRETGGLLNDVTRVGDLLFGADIFFVNGVPILNAGLPSSPVTTAILDFRAFGDDNGTGIAADGQLVFLTTNRSRLMIGQYLSIQDGEGVPPSVTLTAPAADATPVAGTFVTVVADAADDVAVERVDFLLDGEVVFSDFTQPFDFTLTVPATDEITLGARAVDYGGNVGVAEDVVITVLPDLDAPVIGAVTPAAGTPFTSGDAMLLSAEVSDNVAVTEVVFQVGTRTLVDTQAPFEVTASAPPVFSSTELAIRVEAGDPSGNRSAVDFTVPVEPIDDTEPPQPRFLFPGDGDVVLPGDEITVELEISDDHFIDSYSLTLDGEEIGSRFFIEQPFFTDQVPLTLPADALPGESFTLRLEATDFGGNVNVTTSTFTVIDGSGVLTGDQTLDSSYDGQSLLLGAGTFTVVEPLSLADLTLLGGARVVGVVGEPLSLTVAGSLDLNAASSLDVSGLGFAGGNGNQVGGAPTGLRPSSPDAGGSHGGVGIRYDAGTPGEVYDSVYLPQLAGGGGAGDNDCCGTGRPGGGVLELTVGELRLNGEILALGLGEVSNAAGGAGGSVLLEAGTLSGSGRIDATGGSSRPSSNSQATGAGGGGRIALYVDQLVGFDPDAQAVAQGGTRRAPGGNANGFAAPGTVFVHRSATSVYGSLLIDNGVDGDGNDRPSVVTELPPLGEGAIVALSPSGADAVLTAAEPFRQRQVGTWLRLFDATGAELGVFQVLGLDASGDAVLAGAGGVSGAASFAGEYRFDRVTLRHGAGLLSRDRIEGTDFVVEPGASELPVEFLFESLTLRSGAVATVAEGGTLLGTVTGALTIEAGASLDVSGLGFPGGTGNQRGGAPAGLVASTPDAGGSHGGAGIRYDAGSPGEVYDSVYLPQLAGGGGAGDNDCCGTGRPGGGVIELVVGELILDGEILARGLGEISNASGGAGGSVLVDAGTLSGSGRIDVTGGSSRPSSNSQATGAGGGGRVALYVDELAGFDPDAQVVAQGGTRRAPSGDANGFATPGTVFVFRNGASVYGSLRIDNGVDGNGDDRPSAVTELPPLGEGAVASLTPAGADAVLTAAEPFRQRWIGAYVRLSDAADAELGVFQVLHLDASGNAVLAGAGGVTGAASFAGEYRFDRVELLHGAGLVTRDPISGTDIVVEAGEAELPVEFLFDNLTLRSGALVTVAEGGTLLGNVTGTLTIEAGAVLDVSGRGFAGGTGNQRGGAPTGLVASTPDAGGSHGGTGIRYDAGSGGEVYDSVYLPQLAGGGGAGDNDCCGTGRPGGGVIELVVGELVLDGEILARGLGEISNASGGAGGSVLIDAGTLSGSGMVDVSGGSSRPSSNSQATGAGGGGRVALYVDQLAGFDPDAQVVAQGGTRRTPSGGVNGFAAPGTVFVFRNGASTYGNLRIDNGVDANGEDRPSPVTELPALGDGTVVALSPTGGDAVLTTAEPFRHRWIGAWLRLSDALDTELGTFQVLSLDASGNAVLAGAGGVTGAASYAGEYRFDRVELIHGAGLVTRDRIEGTDFVVEPGGAELPVELFFETLTLTSGAAVTVAEGGTLRATVNGTLTIEDGAVLDVSGLGFGGGTGNQVGGAPLGVRPSSPDAGGSHGGLGIRYDAGSPGEVYDSVFLPELPGGGGAGDNDCCGTGRPGGGVIELVVGELVLDGEILALGLGEVSNAAGGAGGSVRIDAGMLSGSGTIDVSGGSSRPASNSQATGAGGGGRVALYVDQLDGFDPAAQVMARGGTRRAPSGATNGFAAPGTVFVETQSTTFGDLIVDQGGISGQPVSQTPLPSIGAGLVGAVASDVIDPTALWVEPQDPAKTFALGVSGMVARIGGVDYPVVAQTLDRRSLLLEGAVGIVGIGDAFQGVYKLDTVTVHGGAVLVFDDEPDVGGFDVDPDSQVIDNSP